MHEQQVCACLVVVLLTAFALKKMKECGVGPLAAIEPPGLACHTCSQRHDLQPAPAPVPISARKVSFEDAAPAPPSAGVTPAEQVKRQAMMAQTNQLRSSMEPPKLGLNVGIVTNPYVTMDMKCHGSSAPTRMGVGPMLAQPAFAAADALLGAEGNDSPYYSAN